MTPVLALDNVAKRYPGGARAVNGVTFSAAEGELVVLVGPSGCGKSTLLRIVAGLETASGGTVQLRGEVVNGVDPADRNIAMVFQNYALYPHMSVRGNMAYGLKNRKVPKPEIEGRVDEAAALLQIEALLDRKPSQLSGGQRQRVAMGRAIVRHPALFLFDDPPGSWLYRGHALHPQRRYGARPQGRPCRDPGGAGRYSLFPPGLWGPALIAGRRTGLRRSTPSRGVDPPAGGAPFRKEGVA